MLRTAVMYVQNAFKKWTEITKNEILFHVMYKYYTANVTWWCSNCIVHDYWRLQEFTTSSARYSETVALSRSISFFTSDNFSLQAAGELNDSLKVWLDAKKIKQKINDISPLDPQLSLPLLLWYSHWHLFKILNNF